MGHTTQNLVGVFTGFSEGM